MWDADRVREAICEALQDGTTRVEAAARMGVTDNTLRKIAKSVGEELPQPPKAKFVARVTCIQLLKKHKGNREACGREVGLTGKEFARLADRHDLTKAYPPSTHPYWDYLQAGAVYV